MAVSWDLRRERGKRREWRELLLLPVGLGSSWARGGEVRKRLERVRPRVASPAFAALQNGREGLASPSRAGRSTVPRGGSSPTTTPTRRRARSARARGTAALRQPPGRRRPRRNDCPGRVDRAALRHCVGGSVGRGRCVRAGGRALPIERSCLVGLVTFFDTILRRRLRASNGRGVPPAPRAGRPPAGGGGGLFGGGGGAMGGFGGGGGVLFGAVASARAAAPAKTSTRAPPRARRRF